MPKNRYVDKLLLLPLVRHTEGKDHGSIWQAEIELKKQAFTLLQCAHTHTHTLTEQEKKLFKT